jgi:hypothetical protein
VNLGENRGVSQLTHIGRDRQAGMDAEVMVRKKKKKKKNIIPES